MQQCGYCLSVYDESEDTSCPYCNEGELYDDCTEDTSEDRIWTGTCPECDGIKSVECDVCEGEGEVDGEICPSCNGEGDMECPECNGTGEITVQNGKKI